mmetsp:Transcript_28675/g.25658  ORF Transcript_28675/g.25658 Transcript_28675/m.25658 type:complete len:210 (+) Transcript_28675:1075-1704(+)
MDVTTITSIHNVVNLAISLKISLHETAVLLDILQEANKLNTFVQSGQDLNHEGTGDHVSLLIDGENGSFLSNDLGLGGLEVVSHEAIMKLSDDLGHNFVDICVDKFTLSSIKDLDFVIDIGNSTKISGITTDSNDTSVGVFTVFKSVIVDELLVDGSRFRNVVSLFQYFITFSIVIDNILQEITINIKHLDVVLVDLKQLLVKIIGLLK